MSNYQYIQTLGISKSDYILDGLRQNYMSSPAALPGNLTWETATTYDIGVDLGFFDNRLTVSGDYYIRKTTDMIVNGPTVPMCSVLPRRKVIMRICLPMVMSCLWNGKMDLI